MNTYFRRVISASLSPNTESDDVWKAVACMVSPWKWYHGHEIEEVERWFCAYGDVSRVSFFDSGRSALLAILHAFDIGESDEVIVQAFTCVAVPNSVLWAGATPVYADIDERFNLDVSDVEKKVTSKTKAIIVQHTFGIPADMTAHTNLAKKHHLVLIEDCAHALGASYKGKRVGSEADASFYSFGRDKALSSVWGGAAMIRGTHKKPNEKLKKYHERLPFPGALWIVQQLLHPIAFALILPLYAMGVGKGILVLLQKMHLLSIPVYEMEKHGGRPPNFVRQYPNALAALLLLQLSKLDRYTRARRLTAKRYAAVLTQMKTSVPPVFVPDASYLRYAMLVPTPDAYRAKAKKHGILLGNWYHNVIDPTGTDFRAVGYVAGSCPKAEEVSQHIITLPTRIREDEANRVIQLFSGQ